MTVSQNNDVPTMALDFVTVMRALFELEKEYLGADRIWHPANDSQKRFIDLYATHREELGSLQSLEALAATKADPLNAFLEKNGVRPMFDRLDDGTIGVAAILDMLVEWLKEGMKCEIESDGAMYPGFKIEDGAVYIHELPEYGNPLVQLVTKSDDSVWVMIPDQVPQSSFDMILAVFDIMQSPRALSDEFEGVRVPMVDIDQKPDLGFLLGMGTYDRDEERWDVSSIKQHFKFRMNHKGARAKVVTTVEMRLTSVHIPKPIYVIDQPFLVWMTQGESKLPLAVALAGKDSWEKTEGFDDM